MTWLKETDLQVGLGCMRLSTDLQRDEGRARATVHAALDAGVTVFDTAHAYGHDETEYGHNERWLGRFLSEHPRGATARVVTKGGMRRAGLKWIPDGKASTLRAQCEASRQALGREVDLYLLHVVDPKTPLSTSVRALMELREAGLVKAIGLSNVNRAQLDEALALTELAAVQLGVSLLDDTALRGGVVEGALRRGVTVLCHSPLGGPKKYQQLERQPWLVERAKEAGCTPYQWALASLVSLSPNVVVLPGCRRPETVRSSVAIPRAGAPVVEPSPPVRPPGEAEVLLLMGLQGAGKTSAVSAAVAQGYQRLNRDEVGGSLEQLHAKLSTLLQAGVRRVVLDNTYVTRAQRNGAIAVARRHGVAVRGVWHDIEVEQAQINVVTRMLDVHGRLLSADEMKRGKTPDTLPPRGLASTVRMLEPIGDDEGFAAVERVPFVRRPWPAGKPALFLGLDQWVDGQWLPRAAEAMAAHPTWLRVLVGWREGGLTAPDGVEIAVCPHEGGPPTCWCRPPLPGLVLERARALGLSISASRMISESRVLQGMAEALGLPTGC